MISKNRERIKMVYGVLLTLFLILTNIIGCKIQKNENPQAQDPTNSFVSHEVSVLFINVGNADAILLKVDGLFYMIDTGAKTSVPALFGALSICGVDKIKAMFLTHTHSDHIGGMEALANRYAIETLYSAEISENTKNGENKIEKLALELSLDHIKLKSGDAVPIGEDVSFEVIGPHVYNPDDDNDNSLVLRLTVNGRTLLLTGDMQFSEEATLLSKDINLRADVLKVGNHGNPDATSNEFAKAVSPEIAVISTNTTEDIDSANARVKEALGNARIHVTQDYHYGVLLTVKASGTIDITNPIVKAATSGIRIKNIDKKTQTVTLFNEGEDTDISGYILFSERGSEVFVFPEKATIKTGQSITVACIGGSGDYIWMDKKVWHEKQEETGILYDRYGNELSKWLQK